MKKLMLLFLVSLSVNIYSQSGAQTINDYIIDVRNQVGCVPDDDNVNNVTMIQAAIDEAANDKLNNKVSGYNQRYVMSGKVELPSNCILQDITLDFSIQETISSVVLIGNNITLKNVTIYVPWQSPGINQNSLGVIELVNANNVLIENVRIYVKDGDFINIPGNSLFRQPGIHCRTKASNVIIRNVEMGDIGNCILYNESTDRTYTPINGPTIVATNEPIGEGLVVENCILGIKNKKAAGDGVEINAVHEGFTDVIIRNVTVPDAVVYMDPETNKQTSAGLGIGIANCNNVLIEDCDVSNIEHVSGAIHVEHSINVKIINNKIYDCTGNAMDLAYNPGPLFAKNNYIENVAGGINIHGGNIIINGQQHYIQSKNVYLSNNYFTHLTQWSFKIQDDVRNVLLSNNITINHVNPASNQHLIKIQGSNSATPTNIRIINNDFIKGSGGDILGIIHLTEGVTLFSRDNNFDGYDPKLYINSIYNYGTSYEYSDLLTPGSGIYNNQGKIGIGTASPEHKLDVKNGAIQASSSGSNNAVFVAAAKENGAAGIYMDAANGDLAGLDYAFIGQMNDENLEIKNLGNKDIKISTNRQNRIIVKGDGKVGIGNDIPSEKLDVNGNIKASGNIQGKHVASNGQIGKDTLFQIGNKIFHFKDGLFINVETVIPDEEEIP